MPSHTSHEDEQRNWFSAGAEARGEMPVPCTVSPACWWGGTKTRVLSSDRSGSNSNVPSRKKPERSSYVSHCITSGPWVPEVDEMATQQHSQAGRGGTCKSGCPTAGPARWKPQTDAANAGIAKPPPQAGKQVVPPRGSSPGSQWRSARARPCRAAAGQGSPGSPCPRLREGSTREQRRGAAKPNGKPALASRASRGRRPPGPPGKRRASISRASVSRSSRQLTMNCESGSWASSISFISWAMAWPQNWGRLSPAGPETCAGRRRVRGDRARSARVDGL